MELLYKLVNWMVGDHQNPMVWESLLQELGFLYIFLGLLAGLVYHFTNTNNLDSSKQNAYFLIVAGVFLGLLWIYTAIRLFGYIGEYVTFSNYLQLCFWATMILFFVAYVLSFYFFRRFTNTKKRYSPTILTRMFRPKNKK